MNSDVADFPANSVGMRYMTEFFYNGRLYDFGSSRFQVWMRSPGEVRKTLVPLLTPVLDGRIHPLSLRFPELIRLRFRHMLDDSSPLRSMPGCIPYPLIFRYPYH